jgi:hypothetical protein
MVGPWAGSEERGLESIGKQPILASGVTPLHRLDSDDALCSALRRTTTHVIPVTAARLARSGTSRAVAIGAQASVKATMPQLSSSRINPVGATPPNRVGPEGGLGCLQVRVVPLGCQAGPGP